MSDILSNRNGQTIQITFSSRRKKPFAPVDAPIGRVLTNEKEIIDRLKSIPGVKVVDVEFFLLSYKEQLVLMQNTDVLIGMHGISF